MKELSNCRYASAPLPKGETKHCFIRIFAFVIVLNKFVVLFVRGLPYVYKEGENLINLNSFFLIPMQFCKYKVSIKVSMFLKSCKSEFRQSEYTFYEITITNLSR